MRGFPQIEGGVEKHCEELYPKLRDDISMTIYRRKPYVNSDKKYKNIRFIDLPSTTIKGVEAVVHSFLATISTLFKRVDLVHYHNIGPALFAPLLKIKRVPIVLTYHSPNYEHDKWNSIAKKILLFCEKIALKYSDKIIFVNEYQMKKYPQEIQAKSVYIPNGIADLQKSQNTDFLEKHKIEKDKYILSVGRITPEKGFDTLIKAYTKAKPNGYKLVIAGGVEFESGYMKQLEALCDDDVIFTGYTYGDDLAQLYTNASLYVLASRNEGFPLVMLEAMKYELNIVASDIPATHLVKLNDEDYFETDNVDMLADKINQKLEAPHNREYDLSDYDWSNVAKITADTYDSVIKR